MASVRVRSLCFAGALALLAALGFAGCGDDASRLEGHYERGQKYLEDKQYPEAILEFKNMLQIDPNQARAHYGLAKSYLGTKEAAKAYWELQETVRLDPTNSDARLEYGQFLLFGQTEDREQAIEQADQVLAEQPDSLRALLLKGRALEALERRDEARAVYEKAMETSPDEGGPVLLLANLHRQLGENERAEELFRKLTEVEPGFTAHAALAGFLSLDKERDAETEQVYRKGLELAKDDKEKIAAYSALSNFYYARERWDDAENILKEGIEALDENIELVYALARFYHTRGDHARADEMMQQGTQANPDDPRPYLVLSAYRSRIGDIEGALGAAEDALEVAPDDMPSRLRRAELLIDLGFRNQDPERIEAGRSAVAEVLAGDASNPEALFVQAKLELAENRTEEAVSSLRRVIDQRPDWPQAHLLLGSALFVRKDFPAARASLSRALELDAGLVDAAKVLARVHAALGDDDLAIEVGRKALASEQPGKEDVALHIVVAQSLVRQRKFDDAQRELTSLPESVRSAEAWYALGRLGLLRGDAAAARKNLLRAHEADGSRYEVLRALLELDMKEGKLKESAERIGAALKERPDDPKLVQLDGEIALYSGDRETAEARFKRAIELDPNDVSGYEKLARYMMVTGRPDEVVKTYEAALEKNPNQATLHLTLGSLYELQGKADQAIARYEDSIRLDPNLAVAKNNLAYLLAESGDNLDRALELAQQAKEQLPENPNAADTLGWVLYKKNSFEAAIGYLREAVRSMDPEDPQLPLIRQHLALAYEGAGDLKSAEETVDQAIADIEARRTREGGEPTPEPAWAGELRALKERLAKAGT